jgi:hypothetical protein
MNKNSQGKLKLLAQDFLGGNSYTIPLNFDINSKVQNQI